MTMVIAAGLVGVSGAVAQAAAPATAYDFNGNGFPEQVLGSPLGSVGGVAGGGFVTVVEGSANGVDPTQHKELSQAGAVPGEPEANDNFGNSFTSTDFDQDGYADLAVGIPGEETASGTTDTGWVEIFWGSPQGLLTDGVAVIADPEPVSGGRFGDAVTAARFNGDGGPVSLVSTELGLFAFWWFTFDSGTGATRDTSRMAAERHRADKVSPSRTAAAAANDFGMHPAIGDVNGDGFDDMAVGFRDDIAGVSALEVWLGAATDELSQTTAGFEVPRLLAVAAGDFDGSGRDDIAVGVPGEEVSRGGAVIIYQGGTQITRDDRYAIDQDSANVPGTGEAGDAFGHSLATGDIDAENTADLTVGAPGEDLGSLSNAGAALIFYGSGIGRGLEVSQSWHQDSAGVPGTAEAGDQFGWSVGLVDHSGDRQPEITMGAPTENGTDGAVTVLFGSAIVGSQGSITYGAGTLGVTGRNARIGLRVGRIG